MRAQWHRTSLLINNWGSENKQTNQKAAQERGEQRPQTDRCAGFILDFIRAEQIELLSRWLGLADDDLAQC